MQRFLFAILFFSLAILEASAQSPADSLTRVLSGLHAASNLPGFAVAVVSRDSLAYLRGFGFADIARQAPYTENTVQNIGSISKTFIGVSLMKLVETGRLSLDTPINDLLPFRVAHPRFPDDPILVRHLATHTSGIADSRMYAEKAYYPESPQSVHNYSSGSRLRQRYLRKLSGNARMELGAYLQAYLQPGGALFMPANFTRNAPGASYSYSNVGAALAAFLIERVSGQSFDAFTSGLVLRPLRMTASGWSYAGIDTSAHATLYLGDGAALPAYGLSTYPDGGLRTSCRDLALYLQEMMRGYAGSSTLLRPEYFREMMRPHAPNGDKGAGIFWEITKNGNIGHSGADPGVLTFLLFNPEKNYGQVFLTNMDVRTSPETLTSFKKIWDTLSAFQSVLFP